MPEIWIPETADPGEKYRDRTFSTRTMNRRVVDRCKIPTPDGPCGHAFYEGESDRHRVSHIKACAERNANAIRAAQQEFRPDILKPWDPEYAEWLNTNREGIAAGAVRW